MTTTYEKQWDTLRRSLRVCHEAIDSGLIELQNISKVMFIVSSSSGSKEDSVTQLATIKKSIQESLRQATQVTDEMASITEKDPVRSAQVARLEAVTTNYLQEFQQTTQHIDQKIERRKLLTKPTVVGSRSSQDLESGHASEQQQLLREKSSINSSLDTLTNIIAQGRESLTSLTSQHSHFASAGKSLQQLTNRFPVVRNLLSSIHRARVKQTLVLASVVAACLMIVLVWMSA